MSDYYSVWFLQCTHSLKKNTLFSCSCLLVQQQCWCPVSQCTLTRRPLNIFSVAVAPYDPQSNVSFFLKSVQQHLLLKKRGCSLQLVTFLDIVFMCLVGIHFYVSFSSHALFNTSIFSLPVEYKLTWAVICFKVT